MVLSVNSLKQIPCLLKQANDFQLCAEENPFWLEIPFQKKNTAPPSKKNTPDFTKQDYSWMNLNSVMNYSAQILNYLSRKVSVREDFP